MRKYLILVFLFALASSSSAQGRKSQNVLHETFDNTVDFLNYELLRYALKDNKHPLLKEFDKLKGERIEYAKISGFLDANLKGSTYQDLSKEIDGLKDKFQDDKESLIDLLTNRIYKGNKFQQINKFDRRRENALKKQAYIFFIDSINTEIKAKLSGTPQDSAIKENDGIKFKTDVTKVAYSKRSSWWIKLYFVLTFFAGSILILIVQTFWWQKNRRKYVLKEDFINLSKKYDRVKNDKIELLEKYKVSENTLKRVQLEISISNTKSEIVPENISPSIDLEVENSIKSPVTVGNLLRILYFPNPNSDGNFKSTEGREAYLEGASIYKFSLFTDNDASFQFCEERSSVGIALNNRNELILSVAEEANAYNSGASKIVSTDTERGKAALEGSIWRVTQKAKIKYV